jgi:hypothetical protein
MTSPIDAAWIAHVADVLADFHGATDYETTAEYANALLVAYPALREMASQYHNGDAGRDWLAGAVATAVDANTKDGGFTQDGYLKTSKYCPTCGQPLEARGPFDGTEPSSGVRGGHVGFGDTYLDEAGHWFTLIQGALVPPQRILTVVEG